MIRYECDVCTDQFDTATPTPEFETSISHRGVDTKVGIKIIRSLDGVWNGGILCDRCLKIALGQIANPR